MPQYLADECRALRFSTLGGFSNLRDHGSVSLAGCLSSLDGVVSSCGSSTCTSSWAPQGIECPQPSSGPVAGSQCCCNILEHDLQSTVVGGASRKGRVIKWSGPQGEYPSWSIWLPVRNEILSYSLQLLKACFLKPSIVPGLSLSFIVSTTLSLPKANIFNPLGVLGSQNPIE